MLRESGSASAARASRVAAAAGLPLAEQIEATAVPLVDAALGGALLRHARSPFPRRSRAPGCTGVLWPRPATATPTPRTGRSYDHCRAHVVGIPPTVVGVGARGPAVPGVDLSAARPRAPRPGELASLRPGDAGRP